MDLNPVEAPKNFFFGLFRNCLNCDSLRWSHIHFVSPYLRWFGIFSKECWLEHFRSKLFYVLDVGMTRATNWKKSLTMSEMSCSDKDWLVTRFHEKLWVHYSWLPITRTFKGNPKRFELLKVTLLRRWPEGKMNLRGVTGRFDLSRVWIIRSQLNC